MMLRESGSDSGYNELLGLELGYKMILLGSRSSMYIVLIFNLTLSPRGQNLIKITQLPKITYKIENLFWIFFSKFFSFSKF